MTVQWNDLFVATLLDGDQADAKRRRSRSLIGIGFLGVEHSFQFQDPTKHFR